MAPINRNSISLYEDAKATFISLLQQTAQVGAGFIIMLLLTRGNPPGFIVGLSFCLGVGFVAWSENKRLKALDNSINLNKVIITSSSGLNEFLPYYISSNKRAILKTKINRISYPTTLLEVQKLIQKVLSIKTDNLLELAKIVDLEIYKDFVRCDLVGADLRDADLRSVNLEGVYLWSANLEGANLESANLGSTNLRYADLMRADLRSANLENANLEGVKLMLANLESADLRSANLEDANLEGANLECTNLEGANVNNAKFGNNKGLSDSKIKELTERGAIFIDSQGDYSTLEIK